MFTETVKTMEEVKLKSLIAAKCRSYDVTVKKNHNRKLLALWLKQRPRSPDCVMNISKKRLTLEEKNVLYRGLKHHILPKRVDGERIQVEMERVYKSIMEKENGEEKSADQPLDATETLKGMRRLTGNFINSGKTACSSKANQSYHKYLIALSRDDTISIVKFDKGNGICIMEKDNYLNKLDKIINDKNKFQIVESKRKNARHPIFRRKEKIKEEIKKHIKPYVDENALKKLKKVDGGTGKLYGTCKIHKNGYPVRPIVSMIDTPEYKLAKFLDELIKPGIPTTFTVASNREFIERLMQLNHQPDDYCISFDIKSLFTNIPLEETINLVAEELYEENIINKPPMPRSSFVTLLRTATGGMFSHRNKIYRQCDGVSMGNPLAPTLANFFLGIMERKLFNNTSLSTSDPTLYTRYVDDIFCVFRGGVQFV